MIDSDHHRFKLQFNKQASPLHLSNSTYTYLYQLSLALQIEEDCLVSVRLSQFLRDKNVEVCARLYLSAVCL